MSYITPYTEFCKAALKDESIFSTFRSSVAYNMVLEHVSESDGWDYLNIIEAKNHEIMKHIDGFRKNDSIGNPKVYPYKQYGNLSPTTLRYIKVLVELIEIFDTLDGEEIFEFGAGYGGQCRIISEIFNFKSYTIVDLPEVVGIQRKYLTSLNVPNFKCITHNELEDKDYSLFISNYAFSEVDASIQEVYLNRILNRCKHGYVTCNIVGPDAGIPYSHKELFSKIKHSYYVFDETPPDPHHTNRLLIW